MAEIKKARKDKPELNLKAQDGARKEIVSAYATAAKRLGRTINLKELAAELELKEGELKSFIGKGKIFGDLEAVKAAAKQEFEGKFKYVLDRDVFNPARTAALIKAIENRKRLILTSAVSGAPVNKEFFDALVKYAEEMDADIIVYPVNMETDQIDPIFLTTPRVHVLVETVEVSARLALNNIPLTAKQLRPLTGLDNLGVRGQAQIVGSPQMHVRTVATMTNASSPHIEMTTGAITDSNYNGEKYISRRTDRLAQNNHRLGAVVLERSNVLKTSGADYHIRHIEYIAEQSGFMDLNKFYSAQGAVDVRAEALVFGDIHVGETDSAVVKTLREQIKKLRPKKLIIHDLFNGKSISHHDKDKLITLAKKATSGELNLKDELTQVVLFLNSLLEMDPTIEIEVVPSNHDFWLHRWLESGAFVREPHNFLLGSELGIKMAKDIDPLAYALMNAKSLEQPLGAELADSSRVRFLKIGESYQVGPKNRRVELGLHGHAGSNGSKGSLQDFLKAAGRAVFGHTHSYFRWNDTVNIGTFTQLILDYNKWGFSNWVQSMAVVGENGEVQVLQFKNGEWNSEGRSDLKKDERFEESYPRVVPNGGSEDRTGQIDQWSSYRGR